MPSMVSLSFRKYKDVIKVYYIIVIQCIIKNIVNIVLEYSQSIIKAKQGYQYLIEPKAGNKYYKLFMALSNTDPIKYGDNIKLNIEFGAVQGIKCLIDKQEQVLVLNDNVIKSFIVIADPYPSFQLSSKQERGYSSIGKIWYPTNGLNGWWLTQLARS